MKRRDVIAAAGLSCMARAAWAADEGFTLVTDSLAEAEQRYEAEHGVKIPPGPRVRSLVPVIKVIAPQAGTAEVSAPLRIELLFETSSDARILPSTFRVLYGFMKFDLTDNVKQNATISARGLLAEKAMVPKGTHRLFLQIADDRGRVAEQELRIKVS